MYVTAQKANQTKLDNKAWGNVNYNNIQETFINNKFIRREYPSSGLPKYMEKNEENKYAIRENGWKNAWLSSEWKSSHYLG